MEDASTRPPAVAGQFYPAGATELLGAVRDYLDAVARRDTGVAARMLIVPHAGYVYSGPVAAEAYAALPPATAGRFLLVGPSHFVGFRGLAISGHRAHATPLGDVPVDPGLGEAAAPYVDVYPAAHAAEHCLEVQLPFLQVTRPGCTVYPVLTGDDDPSPGVALLSALLDDESVSAVISSDLSHYHGYATARRLDAETAQAITELRPDDVGPDRACGRTAVRAALEVARRNGWQCHRLDLRNSGDTAGDRSRVVGYGAFVLGPTTGTWA